MRRVWSTKWRSASKTSPGKLYTSRLTGLASVSLAAVAIAIAPEQFTKHIPSFLSKKTNQPSGLHSDLPMLRSGRRMGVHALACRSRS